MDFWMSVASVSSAEVVARVLVASSRSRFVTRRCVASTSASTIAPACADSTPRSCRRSTTWRVSNGGRSGSPEATTPSTFRIYRSALPLFSGKRPRYVTTSCRSTTNGREVLRFLVDRQNALDGRDVCLDDLHVCLDVRHIVFDASQPRLDLCDFFNETFKQFPVGHRVPHREPAPDAAISRRRSGVRLAARAFPPSLARRLSCTGSGRRGAS